MAETRNLIEVDGLVKSYGPVKALKGISFSVGEGEVLGFLGPNGAGKSTTLRILSGFMPGDSGRVNVNGFDVGSQSLAVRNSIGYLPEGVPLYPDMRVREYLKFRSRLKGIPRSQRKSRIEKSLDETQTADALLGEPPVLILDEPTVGLDPEQVIQFRSMLREVGRDRTVILSTHILSEVELVCSSVVIISSGEIVAGDTVSELKDSLGTRGCVAAEVAGPAQEIRKALEAMEGVSRVEQEKADAGKNGGGYSSYRVFVKDPDKDAESVFETVKRGGWKLRRLEHEKLSLEEVFLGIVGRKE